MHKWHNRIDPKGYKCEKVYTYESYTYLDEDGDERSESRGPGYWAEGCKTVDISLHQYQCIVCGTIGNY